MKRGHHRSTSRTVADGPGATSSKKSAIQKDASAPRVGARDPAPPLRPALRPRFTAGFPLDGQAWRLQIGPIDDHQAGWGLKRMGKLLERLKQGLRNVGRAQAALQASAQTGLDVSAREPGARQRTELDSTRMPSVQGTVPPAQAPAPQSTRTRKATLSKARRASKPQCALSIWGTPAALRTSLFDDAPSPGPAPLFSGSTIGSEPACARPAAQFSPVTFLQGVSPLGPAADVAHPTMRIDGAAPLTPEDDRPERPF